MDSVVETCVAFLFEFINLFMVAGLKIMMFSDKRVVANIVSDTI